MDWSLEHNPVESHENHYDHPQHHEVLGCRILPLSAGYWNVCHVVLNCQAGVCKYTILAFIVH